MAEENSNEKQFSIQKIYTKDLSFETPNSPKVFTQTWQPHVDFNLTTNVTGIEQNLYEVVLIMTVTVKCAETVAYLAEASQAGIFLLSGFSEQEMGHMLGSFCPNILFPYGREVISDLVNRGGFPQLLLAPINFDALYAQHLQQQAEQAKQAPTSESIN